jgi:integrase
MRGHIERRGQKSWRLKFDIGTDPLTGKRQTRRVTVKGTKKNAEEELNRLLHEIGEGTFVDPSKLTVAEYLDQWLKDYARPNVAPKTAERWTEIVEKHLAEKWKALPLKNLKALHIQSYYTEALESGRRDGKGGLAPRTVHHHHRVLFQALKQAVKWRIIPRNPVEDVDPPKVERKEIRALTPEEVETLTEYTRKTRLRMPSILALTTGMRRGEVFAIRWLDIDLDGAALTVNQSLEQTKDGLRFKEPKSKRSRRRITLSPLTVEALRRHKVAQMKERMALGLGRNDAGLVFTTLEGGTIKPNIFTKEFQRIAKRAKLAGVSFHTLRHTHITQLLRDGENVKVISERAGHSSVATTLDLYGHVLPGMQEAAALKVDAAWGEALSE